MSFAHCGATKWIERGPSPPERPRAPALIAVYRSTPGFLTNAATILVAAVLALASHTPALAQTTDPTALLEHPGVRHALEHAIRIEPQTIEDQVAICEIPAPPFGEGPRAEDYKRRFEEIGLHNVRIDAEGNVIAERPGTGNGPVVVLSGHLDTVFPIETDVTVDRGGSILLGPGISDDCRGLTVLLAIARSLDAVQLQTDGTIIFVGTVGEEGSGNLRGVQHLFGEELRDRVDYFISVDGAGLSIVKDAVASYRYRVTYEGPGGHSYGSFGMPNPIHALGRAIAKIADFRVPDVPRVTFSVGIIEGGTSVNSIAGTATMEVDLRALDPRDLDILDQYFRLTLQEALAEELARWNSDIPLWIEIERWGDRPGGTQSSAALIVLAAQDAASALGFRSGLATGSTDANIPISLGVPSVTIGGGGTSGGVHSEHEWYDTTHSELGTQWVLLFTLALTGVR